MRLAVPRYVAFDIYTDLQPVSSSKLRFLMLIHRWFVFELSSW